MLLVGLDRCRDEEHAVEAGLLATAFGGQQVADMHRIETASKDSDSHWWFLSSLRAS
jgi:hypothetical protein